MSQISPSAMRPAITQSSIIRLPSTCKPANKTDKCYSSLLNHEVILLKLTVLLEYLIFSRVLNFAKIREVKFASINFRDCKKNYSKSALYFAILKFTFTRGLRGFHVYQKIWIPIVDEILPCRPMKEIILRIDMP